MYGVLVVLGWNEAMAVLFNPLYFTFLLIALATTWVWFYFHFLSVACELTYLCFIRYAIIQLGLVGPLFQVTRTIGKEVSSFHSFNPALHPLLMVMCSYPLRSNDKQATAYANTSHNPCSTSLYERVRLKTRLRMRLQMRSGDGEWNQCNSRSTREQSRLLFARGLSCGY